MRLGPTVRFLGLFLRVLNGGTLKSLKSPSAAMAAIVLAFGCWQLPR